MKHIGVFAHHPECSEDCIQGMRLSLEPNYKITEFREDQITPKFLAQFDAIAFPGGIGDSASFDTFFRRRSQQAIADFVTNGGLYLGICMGAYWAGSYYFDLLDSVDAHQYIKLPGAAVRRSYGTTVEVVWNGSPTQMYFYDGCALIGDESRFKTIGRYSTGEPAAIIQGGVGVIGPHPESQLYWYQEPWAYNRPNWHDQQHWALLRGFVDELFEQRTIGSRLQKLYYRMTYTLV